MSMKMNMARAELEDTVESQLSTETGPKDGRIIGTLLSM
jgi:hypothetical protein